MYLDICTTLNNIEFKYDKEELERCVLRHKKNEFMCKLISHSVKIGFDLKNTGNRAVISSLSANVNIEILDAINIVDAIVNNPHDFNMRETVYLDGIRQTDEFLMVSGVLLKNT